MKNVKNLLLFILFLTWGFNAGVVFFLYPYLSAYIKVNEQGSKSKNAISFPFMSLKPPHEYGSDVVEVIKSHADLILVNTSRPFFINMSPKTGCSRMKGLVSYANGSPNYFKYTGEKFQTVVHHGNDHLLNYQISKLKPLVIMDLLKTAPRVVVTRNPYERFLSGYLDWCKRNTDNFRKVSDSFTVNFEDFISMAEKKDFQGYAYIPNHHVFSVSQISKFTQVKYNTILRLEEQDLWYDSFIQHFGLQSVITALEAEGTNFYSSHTMHNSTIAEKIMQIARLSPWKGDLTQNKDGHDNNSAGKLFNFYTPQLARRVFELHRDDFEHFAYPAWDGDPSHFRFL